MAAERQASFQDTGNPVLDSFVNVVAGRSIEPSKLKDFYDTIRELAVKEPGGLKRRTGDGRLEEFNQDNTPSFGGP